VRLPSLAMLAESRPFDLRRARSFAMLAVPACALVASAGFIALPQPRHTLDVTMLDVGQGDAILIETPSGQDILVDGGPGAAVTRELGDEMPWLDRSIDLVVVTHPQADHAMGLLDVLDRYDVGRVIAGPYDGDSFVARALIDAARDEGAAYDRVTAGTTIDLGDGIVLEVLAPAADAPASSNPNNDALVVRLVWRDVSFLLASDIEAPAERALVERGAPLRSTVLKVAHHGSATSSMRSFLDAVQPEVALISAGTDNRYGHPAPDVIDRLDDYAATYTTASDGAIHLRTDGHRLWLTTDR
jgi:competence protein ComEC